MSQRRSPSCNAFPAAFKLDGRGAKREVVELTRMAVAVVHDVGEAVAMKDRVAGEEAVEQAGVREGVGAARHDAEGGVIGRRRLTGCLGVEEANGQGGEGRGNEVDGALHGRAPHSGCGVHADLGGRGRSA